MFKKMRLVSALCAFLVAGTSNSVAIPRYSDFGMVSVGGYNEYDSKSYKRRRNQSFAKSRLGDAKVLRTVLLMLGVPLGLATFCIAGKLGEVGVKEYVMPAVNNFIYSKYKVLEEKFNLAGILGYVRKTADDFDSIGRGLVSLIEYLNGNNYKNNGNLNGFDHSYDNVVAICFMLSLAYKPGKLASSLNELGKLWQSVKKDWIPGFYRRPDFNVCYDKLFEDNTALKESDDISLQVVDKSKKSSGLWAQEFISIPFNTEALKGWLAKAFNANEDAAITFRNKFSNLQKGAGYFDNLNWGYVTRTGDKLTLVSEELNLIDGKKPKLILSFDIPVKENTKGDGGGLIHVDLA